MAICYATSHPFRFTSISKHLPLDTLKFLVTTLRNHDKKVALIWVDEDGSLAIYYEFTRTCHNMNTIVQTTGGDASSLNGKSENPNNKLANITRYLILKSIHKKEIWYFAYQYAIWISLWTENVLRGGVPYFLWHLKIPSYKHIKRWGVRVYIINGLVTRNNIDDRLNRGYFMVYAYTTGVILYWKPYQPFDIHRSHHFWFDEYNYPLSVE